MAEDRTVLYTMRLIDNVSSTRDAMATSEKNYQGAARATTEVVQQEGAATVQVASDQTALANNATIASSNIQTMTVSADGATASEQTLSSAVNATNSSMMARQVNFISQVTMLRSLHASIALTTSGFQTLGIANADTIKGMQQLSAVMGIAVGIGQGFKGVTMLVQGLRDAEIAEAAVASFRAVLANPLALGLVAAGIGAAGGLAAGLMMNQTNVNQNTTNQTTISFTAPASSSDQRQASRGALEAMGGF